MYLKLSLINHRASYLCYMAWALDVEVRKIAEIGVNKGETSTLLRHLFPEATFYLIDPWQISTEYIYSGSPISRKADHYEKAYKEVFEQFQADPNVTLLRMKGCEAAPQTPNDFDLVFIDADHSYEGVKENILTWLPKVRPGGLLAGHDYEANIPFFEGVKRAVDEILGKKIMLGKDRLWLYLKN